MAKGKSTGIGASKTTLIAPFIVEAFKEVGIDIELELSKPLQPEEVDIKPQGQQGEYFGWAAYIDNRAAINIKNRCFGIGGWYTEEPTVIDTKKGICFLTAWSIRNPKTGAHLAGPYWDGADDSDIEPIKGGISNAYKRTMPHFFPACADLYFYPEILSTGIPTGKKNDKGKDVMTSPAKYEVQELLDKIVELFNKGTIKPKEPIIMHKRGERDWVLARFQYRKVGEILYDPKNKKGAPQVVKEEQATPQPPTVTKDPVAEANKAAYDKAVATMVGKEWKVEGEGVMVKGLVKEYDQSMKDAMCAYIKHSSRKHFIEYKSVIFAQLENDVVMFPGDSKDVKDFYIAKWKMSIVTNGKPSKV